ncbi:rho GTPase-activating protein 19 isoform X2 [Pseudoliparis swirei]|uniref:rho GTPase-activating protein 19 isoform X2 n=1 Tax=Pseudoliparis swirei TaxID=2059687 RepID=UPI0024BD80EC|nr:rho GTPase-activating protein 19 isoform X2 [Pseudoliparis swirei]
MAAGKDVDENAHNRRGPVCGMVIGHEASPGGSGAGPPPPVILDPDFFVEKLRHEKPDVFLELVLSNVTRLIDLPGGEFAQLLGEERPKTPTGGGGGGFFRSFNFLKRKDKGVVFGAPLTEAGVAQIYQLIEYLSQNLQVEGLFRVPGNSARQQALKELLNSGADVDLQSGAFHPHDVATLLKTFLGELPEPLLTQRHLHAHLKIADLRLLDAHGARTLLPHKERQVEALQLLLLLLPPVNRLLLRLLLELLHRTARQQLRNKMTAGNLALMFAPHVVWPRHMTATDLKDNLKKLNSSMAFLIKHSQKLFRAPGYLRDYAKVHFTGTTALQTKDDLEPLAPALKRPAAPEQYRSPAQQYTEEALKELFRHVHLNMPDSAKKKKLVRQLVKQTTSAPPPIEHHHQGAPAPSKKHLRSRSFGGLIKRRARGEQLTGERRLGHVSPDAVIKAGRKADKENGVLRGVSGLLDGPLLGRSHHNALKVSKHPSPCVTRMRFSPAQEISL